MNFEDLFERTNYTDRTFDRRPEQHERTRIAGIRYALSSRDLSAQFHGPFGKNGKISPLSVAATSVGNRPRYSPAVDSLTRPWRTRGLKRSFQSYIRWWHLNRTNSLNASESDHQGIIV